MWLGKGFLSFTLTLVFSPPLFLSPEVIHVGVALCEDLQIKLWQPSKDIHGFWQSIFL